MTDLERAEQTGDVTTNHKGHVEYSFDSYGIERLAAAIRADEREKCAPMGGKYAEVLVPFVALMEHELHANSSKGDRPGWLTMAREVALLEIYWHAAKLSAAVKNNDAALIREHAADVANMAMMALDVCGHLLPTDSESAGRSEGGV
jgi:hypothetical protein